MAGSFEVAGIRVDHGSHRLHDDTDPTSLAELRALLGDDLQRRPRNGRILLGGRWLAFPLRTTNLLRGLPAPLAAAMAFDALTGPLRRARADTYAEVVRAGLGPTVAATFYGPYARKLWGVGGDELTGEVARRRISAKGPAEVAARLVRAPLGRGVGFWYPRRGFGQIAEALAADAVAAGVDLRLGEGAARIGGIGESTLRVRTSAGTSIDAAQVWSSAPIGALTTMIEGVPDAVVAAAGRLEHRGLVLVYLVLDSGRWTSFDAHYLPGADQLAARISEPRNYRDSPEDPAGTTVLCAEVPATVGDAVWGADPDVLATRLIDDWRRAGLSVPEPAGVEVRRLPRVYPVYRPGHERDLAAVERWLAGRDGLVSFGRQGLFVADNTHHMAAMADALVGSTGPDGRLDAAAWRSAREGFRSYVVAD